MLLFISRRNAQTRFYLHVSIHLMLLFIIVENNYEFMLCAFQYISCYSLSVEEMRKRGFTYMFQYISCYSLSSLKTIMNLCYARFNTSHVTLYLGCNVLWTWVDEFQYISCYSLSAAGTGSGKASAVFQYISCYSLSRNSIRRYSCCRRFNTSHVTLYLARAVRHSMVVMFQYISCYSLSCPRFKSERVHLSFNTSHVTLYLFLLYVIISCLYRFNTSHVTLYPYNRVIKYFN